MKLNFNREQLTPEMRKQLDKWRYAADPTERIFTDFYTWTRWGILEDYYTAMKDAVEMEDREDAMSDFDAGMAQLRQDYIRDLNLWHEMRMITTGMFCPMKLTLQWKNE